MGAFVPPDPDPPDPAIGPEFGPQNLNLEWTVRNTSDHERTEVLTIPAHFPEGSNGVMPVNLGQYSFKEGSTTYHTSWTVLTTWAGGAVRFAKGYITITILAGPTTVITLQLVKSVPGGSSYSEHANAEFDLLQSDLLDVYGNYYSVDMLDVSSCEEEDTLESNDHMKVYFRRTYHPDPGGGTSLGREFFSLTWYLYIPTNSRFAQLEVRLGNDFQGEDDYPESGPDPNKRPLGAMGFKSWRIIHRSTYSDSIVENQHGFGIGNPWFPSPNKKGWTLADDGLMKTNLSTWWAPGGAESIGEYLADGASIARNFFFYFNGGSPTGDEANTWLAIQDHPLCAVQTVESISKTEAAGIYHANYGYVEDIRPGSTKTGTTVDDFITHAGHVYDGRRLGWKSKGSRGGVGHDENNIYETFLGGNLRGGMDKCYATYFSGHWKHVRYYYLNGIQSYMRPGRVLWNIKIHHKQGNGQGETNINFNLTQYGPFGTPFPDSVNQLNRKYRKAAHARGTLNPANNSSTVKFDVGGGLSLSRFGDILWGNRTYNFQTEVGGAPVDGLRRIFIEGDTQSRIVTGFYPTRGNGELTMDGDYAGSPDGSGKKYVLCNDPADADYSRHRLNVYEFFKQWGIHAENATHGANDCAFEGWQLTGSWMLLDNIRHCAEMFMGAYRSDDEVGVKHESQVRACTWPAKYILEGYIATKYLPRYRDQTCAARYKEALLARHTRLKTEFAPTGVYKETRKWDNEEPVGTFGNSYVSEIKDCITWQVLGGYAYSDNSRMGEITSATGVRPITTKFTERFGRSYYACVIHQVGYFSHILWAIWLELRGSGSRADDVKAMAEGTSNFMLDHGVVYDYEGSYASGDMPNNNVMGSADNKWGFLDNHYPARNILFQGPNIKYIMRFGPKDPSVAGGYTQDPVRGECIDKMGEYVLGTDPLFRSNDPEGNGTNEMGKAQSIKFIPGCSNPFEPLRCCHPPVTPESFTKNGDTGGYGISSFCAGSFGLAFRYHSNVNYRIKCGDVLKRWFHLYMDGNLKFEVPKDDGPAWYFKHAREVAPMLGDYPFDAGDPTAGRWDPGYGARQKISCDTNHSGYEVNDVIRVKLPANVVSSSVSPAYYDVRVVYQTSDRKYEEIGRAINVKPSSGEVYINFRPFVAVAPGINIGAQSEYAYYLYYNNVSPNTDPPDYVNVVSIDGPYSRGASAGDVDTVFLWNMEGSLYNDLGSYGIIPIAPNVGYTDGPFGGSAVFNGVNTIMVTNTHDKFTPDGAFSIDMQVYVATAHLNAATSVFTLMTRWGDNRPLFLAINPIGAGGDNEIIADFRMSGNIVRLLIPTTAYSKDTWFNLSYKYDGNSIIGSVDTGKKTEVTASGTLDDTDDDHLWVGELSIFGGSFYTGALAEIRWSDTDRDLRTVTTKMTVTFGTPDTYKIRNRVQPIDVCGAVEIPDIEKPIDSAGYLRIENLYKEVTADGTVADAKEMTGLDADGAVQISNLYKRLTCDCLISGTGGQKYVRADGIIAIIKTDAITSDGIVGEADLFQNLLTDGVLATIEAQPIDADGAIQEVDVGKILPSDGCLKAFDLTKTVASAGYVIRFNLGKTVDVDGAIQEAGAEKPLQTDGCLKVLDLPEYLASVGYVGGVDINKELATDGTVALVKLKPLITDGAIQFSGKENAVLCDAHVIAFITLISDGCLQIAFSKTLPSDACLKVLGSIKELTSDGAVAFLDSKTVNADGTVAFIYHSNVDADGTVAYEDSKSIYCDGFVEDPNLIVVPVAPVTVTPEGRQG